MDLNFQENKKQKLLFSAGTEPTTVPGDLAAGERVNRSATRGGRSLNRAQSRRAKIPDYGYFGLKLVAFNRFRLTDQNETKYDRKI